MQKVPKKTFFYHGLLKNWPSKLKVREPNTAFKSEYFSKKFK